MSGGGRRFGAFLLGCAGERLTPEERRFFSAANPFGFILFARNIDGADQIRALCADLREAVGWKAPVFIDQEGGRVQRIHPPLARDWMPPLDQALALQDAAPQGFYLRYRIIAAELRALGIDGNCAPMLDIARAQTHAILRNRCYGKTLDRVIAIGQEVARAHLDGGVLPVVKHIPGHGLAQLDSHLDLPRINAPREVLAAEDFAAFRPFAGLPLGMTAHLIFEDIAPEPATVSQTMLQVIRQDIGFDGLIMTDDISMEALTGTVAERGRAALRAGYDAVLHCNGDLREMQALHDQVGEMTEAAQLRAMAALQRRTEPEPVDIAALAAQLEALSNGRGHG